MYEALDSNRDIGMHNRMQVVAYINLTYGSKLLMSNTRVWDPLTASVRNLTENIMNFVFIKY